VTPYCATSHRRPLWRQAIMRQIPIVGFGQAWN
jgi:hypothetical protein